LRLGILGGAFNPPHLGHLVCAQEAFVQLELERVLMVPVGEAAHRELERDPGPEVRLELCRAAIAGDGRLACSRLELDRSGPSYTVETLQALHEERPGDELVLLLGADQAGELPRWREPEQVLSLAGVAVAARSVLGPEVVRERLEHLAGADRLRFFDMPRIDISSSLVRARAGAGLPIRYLVPEGVERLVAERGLYRVEVGAR
jgi:nicotinate-nucleotide adenylyltransferase